MSFTGNKITLAAIISFALTAPATSADWYSSLELGVGSFNTSFSTNIETSEADIDPSAGKQLDSATTIRLSIGNYVTNDIRIYLYNHGGENYFGTSGISMGLIEIEGMEVIVPISENIDFNKADDELGLGADYHFQLNKRWSLIAGGSLGYYKSKLTYRYDAKVIGIEGIEDSLHLKSKTEGLSLGLNTGIGLSLNDNWSIEGGARYINQDNEHTIQHKDQFYKYRFKDATQYYMNATYVF